MNYRAVAFSFDGEYVVEKNSNDISYLWNHISDIGSKWYFYPFWFICTEKSIKETSDGLEFLTGKRITTIQKLFNETNNYCKENNLEVECFEFINILKERYESSI